MLSGVLWLKDVDFFFFLFFPDALMTLQQYLQSDSGSLSIVPKKGNSHINIIEYYLTQFL